MHSGFPIDIFTALRLDHQALIQLHFCWDQMQETTDARTAPFYRQAFARAVFSYFIAASNLLWTDTRLSNTTVEKPPQDTGTVFSDFLTILRQHGEVSGKPIKATLSDDEEQLLNETEQRLGRLVLPNSSFDLTMSTEEIERLTRAVWVLDRVVRG